MDACRTENTHLFLVAGLDDGDSVDTVDTARARSRGRRHGDVDRRGAESECFGDVPEGDGSEGVGLGESPRSQPGVASLADSSSSPMALAIARVLAW